jgi:hypothetical protein
MGGCDTTTQQSGERLVRRVHGLLSMPRLPRWLWTLCPEPVQSLRPPRCRSTPIGLPPAKDGAEPMSENVPSKPRFIKNLCFRHKPIVLHEVTVCPIGIFLGKGAKDGTFPQIGPSQPTRQAYPSVSSGGEK